MSRTAIQCTALNHVKLKLAGVAALLSVFCLLASASGATAAARPRLEGRFAVTGKVTSTHNYKAQKGKRFTNYWVFRPSPTCRRFVACDRIKLARFKGFGRLAAISVVEADQRRQLRRDRQASGQDSGMPSPRRVHDTRANWR